MTARDTLLEYSRRAVELADKSPESELRDAVLLLAHVVREMLEADRPTRPELPDAK